VNIPCHSFQHKHLLYQQVLRIESISFWNGRQLSHFLFEKSSDDGDHALDAEALVLLDGKIQSVS
jgi:hypothetical protein